MKRQLWLIIPCAHIHARGLMASDGAHLAFGSPDYTDVQNAVKIINEFYPPGFIKPTNDDATKKLIGAAQLIADRLRAAEPGSKEYERLSHVLDKLKIPGNTLEEKLVALERHMKSEYKVDLGMGPLQTLVDGAVQQKSNSAQKAAIR